MGVHETVGRNQKQVLLTLHHSNEAVLDAMKTFVPRTEPLWRIVREFPYADRLPTARESVEQWFGFFTDVLHEEREFLLNVVGMLPDHRVTPVVKSTPKAA